MFPSYMPHRVEQVKIGTRVAMVAFFEGSDSRFEDMALAALTSSVMLLPQEHKLRTLLGEARFYIMKIIDFLLEMMNFVLKNDEVVLNRRRRSSGWWRRRW